MGPMKIYFEYLLLKLSFLIGKIKKKLFPSRPEKHDIKNDQIVKKRNHPSLCLHP
jgi:hypothetical protein